MTTTRKKARRRVTDTVAEATGAQLRKPRAKKPAVLTNNFAIVVDRSSSMRGHERQVVDTVNRQFSNIRAASQAEGQKTFVWLRNFASYVDSYVVEGEDVDIVRDWTRSDYRPNGMTALNDALGFTIQDLQRVRGANSKNTSFVVFLVTDGGENQSSEFGRSRISKLQELVRKVQGTDRWTIVALVPPGHSNRVSTQLGIPIGNVREWTQTEAGFRDMEQDVGVGIKSFYAARSAGATSTPSFFAQTNHIREIDLTNLDDVSGDFFVWKVDTVATGEKERIDNFVNARLGRNVKFRRVVGDRFQVGRGYYELTKPELVQETKDMVIQDRSTGKYYGGEQARALLRIPLNERVRVRPGDHTDYRIFIKSTASNRNLIGGTNFLYRKN